MSTHASHARIGAPAARAELVAVVLALWLALAAIPIALGGIGISWDALNHQVYLGWTAFSPRFDRDWLAASYQSYTWPYLYWPFYKLVELQVPGMWAGAVLVSLHVLMVPALWIIARACVPERSWEGTALRAGAVLLAFLGQLALSLMDSTANDLYAASPLVWAVALGILAPQAPSMSARLTAGRAIALSGVFAGISVAFKLSNGPLVLAMPVIWGMVPGTLPQRLRFIVAGTAWSVVAFALAYAPWGIELWRYFGNPLYPFCDDWFATVRQLVGWHQP